MLPFFPSQVSFNTRTPENSSWNDSETASVEVVALALMEDEAVHTLPTTCDPLPKRSVSRDMTDSFGMMKYLGSSCSMGILLGIILFPLISISVLR